MVTMQRYEIENKENWREACKAMPKIRFPVDWDVTIIPAFRGAMVRFVVDLPCGTHKSIYADFNYSLGYFGNPSEEPIPYWEVYPYKGDVGRCGITEVDQLLGMIADISEEVL